MAWTDEDTAAYWDDVRREEATDRFRLAFGRGGVDPLAPAWTREGAVARLQAAPAWPLTLDPPEPDEPVEGPREDWRGVFMRAVGMLPRRHREVLSLAYLGTGGWVSRGGRSGDGVRCARALGVIQPRWVIRLDCAEQDLAVVAQFARASGGGWDRDRVVAACPWPEMAAAYLESWNSLETARVIGVRQSTLWGRLVRGGPVLAAVRNRPKRDGRLRGE